MRYVAREFSDHVGDDVFATVASWQGETFREVLNRRTLRVEFGGRGYFAKVHRGVGWREIVKNLAQLRLPVVSAMNEFNAIRRLTALGVDTMRVVACARRGWNPARVESCIVTEELAATQSLEDLAAAGTLAPLEKRRLIARVARIARTLHRNGVNHRDFYLCHFLASTTDEKVYLIDLHRAQLRARTPRRWVVKDVGGLLFSAFDAGLTRRDCFRFVREYTGGELRQALRDPFWQDVLARACRLYLDEHPALTSLPRRLCRGSAGT